MNLLRNMIEGVKELGRDAIMVTFNLPSIIYEIGRIIVTNPTGQNGTNVPKQIVLAALTPVILPWRAFEVFIGGITGIWFFPTGITYDGNPAMTRFSNENWYFINGICTDEEGVAWCCRRLEDRFRQRIRGIYNRTYGLFVDGIECMEERSFDVDTRLTSEIVSIIARDLDDTSISKVVLIGHSQGTIILELLMNNTTIVDLVTQYPGKLSVCTFASAADEFTNINGNAFTEHYANEFDPVAKIGVWSFLGKYQGTIYMNRNREGHPFSDYSLNQADYTPNAGAWLVNL